MSQIELFKSQLPKKAFCSDYLANGLIIRNTNHALKRRYIQHNHPNSKLWLAFDIDRKTSVDEITDDLHMPPPHFFTQNPENGHAHLLYALETPVHLNYNSSGAPIRFAGAVDAAMTRKLGADPSYVGLITKNPSHEHWRTYATSIERYELAELADYLDLTAANDRRRKIDSIGLGRNCNVFESLRLWAGRAIRQGWPEPNQWLNACIDRGIALNSNLEAPLPPQEVMHIAKSVAKWTHRNLTEKGFSQWQSNNGQRSGIARAKKSEGKRATALAMIDQGLKQKTIAEELGISAKTVTRWKKGH